MRPWRRITVAVLALAAMGAVSLVAGPRVSPRWARAAALRAFKAGRLEQGIVRFRDYAQRFARHAAGRNPVTVGNPLRLRVEPHALGALLSGPALPPPATAFPDDEAAPQPLPPTRIEEGPIWLDERRVIYVARRAGAPPSLAVLDVLSRAIEVRPLPEPRAYTLTFDAAASLYERPDESAVLGLRPDLGGAREPRLLAVSPDGSWLVFRATAATTPPYELWRCRPDGTDARRLAAVERTVAGASFAPDGSRLAFFDGPRVYLVGLADTEPTLLRQYDPAAVLQPTAPAWSSDGGTLAYGVGSAGALTTVLAPLARPDQAVERPRLNALEALELIAPARLLQSERELDKEHWLVTLRGEQDDFASRILVDNARYGRLSPDGLKLAWRAVDGLGTMLLGRPLGEISPTRLPADSLPERPTGTPGTASPDPDSAAPRPPSRQT